jgi:hypothetical protein
MTQMPRKFYELQLVEVFVSFCSIRQAALARPFRKGPAEHRESRRDEVSTGSGSDRVPF